MSHAASLSLLYTMLATFMEPYGLLAATAGQCQQCLSTTKATDFAAAGGACHPQASFSKWPIDDEDLASPKRRSPGAHFPARFRALRAPGTTSAWDGKTSIITLISLQPYSEVVGGP